MNIGRFNRDLVISSDEVYLGENSVASQSCSEILDVGNRVSVWDGAAL